MKLLFSIFCIFFQIQSFAQTKDSLAVAPISFSGNVAITNNGVSLVPTFSLGKPAVLVDLAIKGKRLSFEPLLNFATDKLRPWGFIFWVRYKVLQKEKFKLKVGAHPSFVFSAKQVLEGGVKKEVLAANRYFAAEIAPSYALSKKTTIGVYLLGANQIAVGVIDPTYFLALNAVSTINFPDNYFVRVIPQFYFLKLSNQTGTYANGNMSVGKKGFPISINGMVSKSIKTDIQINKFVWSAGLMYSF